MPRPLSLLLFALLGSLAMAQDQRAAFLVPLQALLHRPLSTAPLPWATLLRPPTEVAVNLVQLDGSDPFANLESEWLDPRLRDSEGLALQREGDQLLLVGTDPALSSARDRALAVLDLLSREVRVEFAGWDASDRDTPSPVLTANDYATFAANRTPLWHCSSTLRVGGSTQLQRWRWTTYARGVDLGIAKDAVVAVPAISTFGDGGLAALLVFGLTGVDDLVVHLQYAAAQRRGLVRTQPTGTATGNEIDLPVLESYFGTASALVANGGAMAITLRGHASTGGQLVLTLRVTASPAKGEAARNQGVFPIGALSHPALTQGATWEHSPGDQWDGSFVVGEPRFGTGAIGHEHLHDLLSSMAGLGPDEGQLKFAADHVFVYAPPAERQRVEAALRELQQRQLRTVSVQHTGSLTAPEPGASSTSVPLFDLVGPTLLGRRTFASRCLETNAIRHPEEEVAEGTFATRPAVEPLQSGLWTSTCVTSFGERLLVDTELHCAVAATPLTRIAAATGAVFSTVERSGRDAAHRGSATLGKPIDHGDGPSLQLEGRSYRSAIATTVR
jgi:hypothetical protein